MLRKIKNKARRLLEPQDLPASKKLISLQPEGGRPRGNVLISYIVEPFMAGRGGISNAHTHFWESYQMAQTFLSRRFSVDVVSYLNRTFTPEKHYDFFVSARTNLERIAGGLNADCTKVAHLDTAHWIYNNKAAHERMAYLLERRGFVLGGGKCVEENWAIEVADLATVLGNRFTMDTYGYSGKPVYRIPISAPCAYPWDSGKDFSACRKTFLWFGSSGFVHKGLDIVLDAFSQMTDYTLYVCGPFDQESRFLAAYHKALYETENIKAIGWVDVESGAFRDVVRKCVGLVYPTCAEGGGGSVINCMHAGLIPIVTYQASVDIDEDMGVVLKDAAVETVRETVERFSNRAPSELESMARNAWNRARSRHTRESFAKAYEEFVDMRLL